MRNWIGMALSGALLMTMSAGCSPKGVASAGLTAPSGKASAGKLAGAAQLSLSRADLAAALRDAEAAVALAPADAAHRALLGRVYMASGRFRSAEAAFADALTLDPAMARVRVMQGLVQLIQGKNDAALASLDMARQTAPAAEVGLALALADRPQDAIELLSEAARGPGADARTRQNLAMALAFAGRWNEAAAVAHSDMTTDQIVPRLQRWAQIAQLATPAKVLAILGVDAVQDPGQPASLALAAPAAVSVELAANAPAPSTITTPAPAPDMAASLAIVEQSPAVTAAAPAASITTAQLQRGDTATMRVAAVESPASMIVLARQARANPKPIVRLVRTALASARPIVRPLAKGGGYVVQLGAFASSGRVQAAWNRLSGKTAYLTGYTPAGSGVRAAVQGGTLYRLAVGGFDSRADAVRLCARIRSQGGECFVRASAGDRPMRWAQRDGNAAA